MSLTKIDRILVAKRSPRTDKLEVRERLIKHSSPKLCASDRRAQATMMMVRRLMGEGTIKELAADFHLLPKTINNRLSLARTDGVPDMARQIFIDEMLPQSIVVLKDALDGDDMKLAVQVALKIVDGLKALELPPAQQPAGTAGTVEESFEIWKARRIVHPSPSADVIHASGHEVIDVEALPAGDSGAPAEADANEAEPVCVRASTTGRESAAQSEDSTPSGEGSGQGVVCPTAS